MSYFVEVILPLALDKTFTYQVSEAEFKYVKPGMRIAVPFGKSKMYTALAIETHQNPPSLYEAKEIHQILDENSIVNDAQLKHWQWIASYYMCSIGEVYRAALPSGFLLESETIISLKQGELVDEKALSDDEFLVFEALHHQSSLKVSDVISILNKKNVFPVLQKLIDKKVVALQEEMHETYKPKLVRYIKLHLNYSTDERLNELLNSIKAEKQKELLLGYFQLNATEKKPISAKQLIDFASSNSSVLKKLIEKEVFEEYHLIQDRTDFNEAENAKHLSLSQSQQKALDEIKNHFATKDVCLLHGVTSSGKTEIYSKLIQETMKTGKQILFLLPEIALTTQLVSRLRKFFGNTLLWLMKQLPLN